jgi:hypothetical protein
MSRSLVPTIAALALIAAALPGAAQAKNGAIGHTPVPAGQLQHTVTVISFPKSKNSPVPHKRLADGTFPGDTLRTESWIGQSAGRTVTKDLMTHRTVSDCAYTLAVAHCFEAGNADRHGNNIAPNGVVWIYPGAASLLQSWADAGAAIQSLLGVPKGYVQTGTTTYLGRPAVILEQATSTAPGGVGTESATVIAEADNYYPLRSEDISHNSNIGKKQHFDQVTQTKVLQVVSPTGVKLTIGSYPKAQIKDERKHHRNQAVG